MISDTAARDAYQHRLGWRINAHLREEETMPEMTPDDLARFRHAVQLRDRCVKAAVERMVYLGDAGDLDDQRAARVAYDAMAELIRTDERERLAAAGRLPPEGAPTAAEALMAARDDLNGVAKRLRAKAVETGDKEHFGLQAAGVQLACFRLVELADKAGQSAVPPEPKEGAGGQPSPA